MLPKHMSANCLRGIPMFRRIGSDRAGPESERECKCECESARLNLARIRSVRSSAHSTGSELIGDALPPVCLFVCSFVRSFVLSVALNYAKRSQYQACHC